MRSARATLTALLLLVGGANLGAYVATGGPLLGASGASGATDVVELTASTAPRATTPPKLGALVYALAFPPNFSSANVTFRTPSTVSLAPGNYLLSYHIMADTATGNVEVGCATDDFKAASRASTPSTGGFASVDFTGVYTIRSGSHQVAVQCLSSGPAVDFSQTGSAMTLIPLANVSRHQLRKS
ncbi:hypothetical protein GCM10028801_29580 [Nocardioides maradonensis]